MNKIDKTKEEYSREMNALKQENAALKAMYEKDITERKKMENELQQMKIFSDKLLEAPKDAIFLFGTATGKPTRRNKQLGTFMSPAQSIRGLIGVIALFIALANFGNYSYAQGFDDKDFSLRFPAALSRFSSYADVAATGGASAGSKWQSSINPASTAWQRIQGSYNVSLSPQYSQILFQEGTVLHVLSESITKDFDNFGTVQMSFAQVRSNERAMRSPLPDYTFSYDMDYFQIQWGKRVSDDLALGGNFNYSSSDVTTKYITETHTHTSSNSYAFRVGTLYRICTNFLGGIVVDYSESPSTMSVYDIFGSGIGDVNVEDRTKQFTFRAGPSYEYSNNSTLNVDYQYISLKNDTGELEVHRMFAGVDNRIVDALFVRGGFALDNHGNTSWTAGLGIYPLEQLSIDIGYQYNMFPEIQAEFGRSHLVTISISVIL
jgi:opacity protein-like surface antigen